MNDLSPIRALTTAGFSLPEAYAVRGYVDALPVESRVSLVDTVAGVMAEGGNGEFMLEIPTFFPVPVDESRAPAVFYNLLWDTSAAVRLRLADALGEIDWPWRVPLLAHLARDPDEDVQRAAAERLLGISPGLYSLIAPRQNGRLRLRPDLLEPEVFVPDGTPIQGNTFRWVDWGRADPTHVCPPVLRGDEPAPAEGSAEAEAASDGGGDPGTPLPAETIRRYTHVAFARRPHEPAAGELTFALRVQPTSGDSHAVDVRVPEGKPHAMILVHASSAAFEVGPASRTIRLPRGGDSQDAVFTVRARAPGEGEVVLLVYDEFRLAGSVEVRLRAARTPGGGLALEHAGTTRWRDPATAAPVAPLGFTVQASLAAEGPRRVQYHVHVSTEQEGVRVPGLVALGASGKALDAGSAGAALDALRERVDAIHKGLKNPRTLGAASADEALEVLRMNLEGIGRQLGDDLFSPVLRALIGNAPAGSVLHWVISDRDLESIPWELARDPLTGSPLGEDVVLVRVPVFGDGDEQPGDPQPPAAAAPGPDRLVYVLGSGVAGPAEFPTVREAVRAARGYQVQTNFDGAEREPVNPVVLGKLVRDARVVHILCHGVVEEKAGLQLAIEQELLGRVSTSDVLALRPAPGALIFVNACSSASATVGATGVTTFGWNFLRVGAGTYIGTLAPVTTTLALRFATEFFDAFLGGATAAEAVFRARRALAGNPDPTWMLYAVYGDVHVPVLSPS